MSEELQNAARKYSIVGWSKNENIQNSDIPDELEAAFIAGAEWHKKQAFKEILKDIERHHKGLIVISTDNADRVPDWLGLEKRHHMELPFLEPETFLIKPLPKMESFTEIERGSFQFRTGKGGNKNKRNHKY